MRKKVVGIVLAAVLVLSLGLVLGGPVGADTTGNLLTNPGAELGSTTGWSLLGTPSALTVARQDASQTSDPCGTVTIEEYEGDWFFTMQGYPPAASTTYQQMTQIVDLTGISGVPLTFNASVRLQTADEENGGGPISDQGIMVVQFWDTTSLLTSFNTGFQTHPTCGGSDYKLLEMSGAVPPCAVMVKFILKGRPDEADTVINVFWDDAFFSVTHCTLDDLSPSEAFNPIGTEHKVYATLTEPVDGITVKFEVSGANTDSGSDETEAGVAEFSYTGANPGEDTIKAYLDINCNDQWDSGEPTLEVTKYWMDRFVSGGGQLIEEIGNKRKDWLVISFGGVAGDAGAAGLVGEWEVNFHNVNTATFDKTKFHTTSIQNMNFYEQSCGIAMNFTAIGEWQGIPGYKMTFRAQDAGEPGSQDNVRIEIRNPSGGKVYDTHWGGEFTDESNCVGTSRTGLDHGNLQMDDLS